MPPFLLATDDVPTGADIKTWLIVAIFLLTAWDKLNKFMGKSEKREISGTVRHEPELITREEFEKVNRERAENLRLIDKKIEGIHNAVTGVHTHIESVVTRLREEISKGDQRVDDRVDEVHERLSGVSTHHAGLAGEFKQHVANHPGPTKQSAH